MTLRLILLAVALFAATARADETPGPDPKQQENLLNFAASHPACMEWSDGCAVCKRDDAVHCSTPGIACQPVEIACKAP